MGRLNLRHCHGMGQLTTRLWRILALLEHAVRRLARATEGVDDAHGGIVGAGARLRDLLVTRAGAAGPTVLARRTSGSVSSLRWSCGQLRDDRRKNRFASDVIHLRKG